MEALLMLTKSARAFFAFLLVAVFLFSRAISAQSLGIFQGQSDVGSVNPPGTAAYDHSTGVYTIHSSGANLWSTTDGFHFLWTKASGDLSLTADISFPEKTGKHSEHRKAVLIFRQTLDADGVYADAAEHGSGLTALQYRRAKGGATQSIELNIDPPQRVRLEKRGDVITMFVSQHGEPLHQSGASIKLHLDEPFYAGVGLSAHDPAAVETAAFSHLEFTPLTPPATTPQLALSSSLQAVEIDPNAVRSTVVYSARVRVQAPNWSRDGSSLIFNQDGHMFAVPVDGRGTPQPIDTGAAIGCNGSHGLSPDGKWLAITCSMPDRPGNRVYIVPSTGGTPRMVTDHPDSYFHTWSPDGKTIVFARPSHGSGNIYAISVDGGAETALTALTGISDDPDYSADGQYIYFNTDRWGGMQIARMHPDGSQVEQITFDNFRNWTPHPSPDGKSIVFISYDPSVTTHAANKDIALRILSTGDNKIRTLINLVGGDGSMNVPNWSPDSKRVAFVSYQMLPAEDTGSSE
jgi:Tol biopolymer transport system component